MVTTVLPGRDGALADAEEKGGGQEEGDGYAHHREDQRLDLLGGQQVVVRLLENKSFFKHFFSVSHLANYIFLNFQIEPELGAGIDPGMAFYPISIHPFIRVTISFFNH